MKEPTIAPIYWVLFPQITEAARKLGYAIAVHGTIQRDLDLVAIPWTDEAVDADALAKSVIEACGGYLADWRKDTEDPTAKPHGRLAWSIHIDPHAYIDLSVMPRITAPPARGPIGEVLQDVYTEITRGVESYPDASGLMVALMEEVGELARAMMTQSRDSVRSEAAQVAALAVRVAIDGDPTLAEIRAKNNADAVLPPIPLYEP